MTAVIAPNSVHFSSEPHRSVVEAFVRNVAKKPMLPPLTMLATTPPATRRRSRNVEQAGHEHQREEARDDEVLDRVDAEHLQRVELLADLARAEVGRDRRAGDAGDDDRADHGRELADHREHEEAAHAVERAEQRQEVRRLQPGRRVGIANIVISSGNQQSFSANRNCETNSPPWYGGTPRRSSCP